MAQHTIAENLQRLVQSLSDIKSHISAKGGTVNQNDGFEELPTAIDSIPTSGQAITPKDVNFYDYDGTLVASYSDTEFLQLAQMPENPTHQGLTSQGWNWTFEDAVDFVTQHSKLNIGQLYITSDGKTRLYVTISEGITNPYMSLYFNNNTTVNIDWGDETSADELSSTTAEYITTSHIYQNTGDYVITITVISGSIAIQSSDTNVGQIIYSGDPYGPNTAYISCINAVEIGSGISGISNYAFWGANSLTSISLPSTISGDWNRSFNSCTLLKYITIPNDVVSIGAYSFTNCFNLRTISFPKSTTTVLNDAFESCSALDNVVLPYVTDVGNKAFYYCRTLRFAIMPNVTIIRDSAFNSCPALMNIELGTSLTSIKASAFTFCTSLVYVNIPNSITALESDVFSQCRTLQAFSIPDTLKAIPSNMLSNCQILQSITIPKSVTSIGASAFSNLYSVKFVKFMSTTPPTITSSTFTKLPTSAKIYVPAGSLSAYTSAGNYPNPNTYEYIEY